MNYEICVIGGRSFLFPFLQFGFTTYRPPSEAALREYLREAIDRNVGIIYMEEVYCLMVPDILDRYRFSLTPIVVPLGESGEGEAFSKRMLRDMMERAIGVNVL